MDGLLFKLLIIPFGVTAYFLIKIGINAIKKRKARTYGHIVFVFHGNTAVLMGITYITSGVFAILLILLLLIL